MKRHHDEEEDGCKDVQSGNWKKRMLKKLCAAPSSVPFQTSTSMVIEDAGGFVDCLSWLGDAGGSMRCRGVEDEILPVRYGVYFPGCRPLVYRSTEECASIKVDVDVNEF